MAKVRLQSAVMRVLDRFRADAGMSGNEALLSLAVLVYLRWTDYWIGEQEGAAPHGESGHTPLLSDRLRWRAFREYRPDRLRDFSARELTSTLAHLDHRTNGTLAVHLSRIAPVVQRLGRIPEPVLEHMVWWLDSIPIETADDRRELLAALDGIIARGQSGHLGYFTPAPIARLIVELGAPVAGESVYDPCFGSAGLLTESVDYVRQQDTVDVDRVNQVSLVVAGCDKYLEPYAIGLTRLALVGVGNPSLELGDSLDRDPVSIQPRYDLVLANPPWGQRYERRPVDRYPVPITDSTALFIQHALSQLRPGGRAVIVVPPSTLFGTGQLVRLRRWLLEEHTVEAVVALPPKAFAPHSSLQGSILLLRRGGRTTSVRMVDSRWFDRVRSDIAHGGMAGPLNLRERVLSPAPEEHAWDADARALAEIDFDLSPRRRDTSGLEQVLGPLRGATRILPLGDLCQVMGGRSISSSQLRGSQSDINPLAGLVGQDRLDNSGSPQGRIPYIRIRDVQKGVAIGGSLWLGDDAAAAVEDEWRLRAGDVLLSKSGTIGRVGIVQGGAVGGVAASGFIVLRIEDRALDPQYVSAYLQSAECVAWLDDRARGTGQRHLPIGAVRGLPVPVPSRAVQQRIAEQWRRHRVDALAFLSESVAEGDDPVVVAVSGWVDGNLVALDKRVREGSLQEDLQTLERLADSSCPVNDCQECGRPYYLDYESSYIDSRERYSQGIATTCLACWLGVGPGDERIARLRTTTPLIDWALKASEVVAGLKQITQVSSGAGLLSILQSVAVKVQGAMSSLTGHLPNEDKARRFAERLKDLIDDVSGRMLQDVSLGFSVLSASRTDAGRVDISLDVVNKGALPVRAMELRTAPPLETLWIPYLAENTHYRGRLSGRVMFEPLGERSLRVDWRGLDLVGRRLSGSREIPIVFTETGSAGPEDASPADLGPSPYVCGDPVKTDRPDVFVGREELLDQIRRQVVQSGNVVLLEGNRRAGKSSILWHLEGRGAVPGWLGVYCSLQGAEGAKAGGIPTPEVFRTMAYEIAQSVRRLNGSVPLPDGTILDGDRKLGIKRAVDDGIGETSPFGDFREYLELVLAELSKQGLGLLLMLDEFDKLQEGIDKKITSSQVPENIRFLAQSYPKFSTILTGSRRLKRLREEYWSVLFGLGTRFSVSSLPKPAADRLLTEPVKGRLAYAADALDLAHSLTAGQPYLLQCLCNRIFDIAARTGVRSITVDQVREASQALVADNEHFASLWDYTRSDRRRFLLALIHRERQGPDPLTLGVIQEKLAGHGIEVREEDLISDLDLLRELEIVDLHGGVGDSFYALAIPMVGDWIERQQDFEALRGRARAETEDTNG